MYMLKKKKSSRGLTKDDMQDLLAEQSNIILSAVDEKIGKLGKSFKAGLAVTEVRVVAGVDKKLVAMELRINQKFDKLTTTLDKFLKRLTDLEDEFEIMKKDFNRMKAILKEKLGVDLA